MTLVLAYHGCSLETAQELLGGSPFLHSTQDYDWLGAGIYFWENDILRAYQWATEDRLHFDHPSVVGAVIELGSCHGLTTQSGNSGAGADHGRLSHSGMAAHGTGIAQPVRTLLIYKASRVFGNSSGCSMAGRVASVRLRLGAPIRPITSRD